MGKYRSNMNLAGHPRGTVSEYDDDDPGVLAKVKSGVLVRLGGPPPEAKKVPAKAVAKKAPAKATAAKKVPAKKAAAKKAVVPDEMLVRPTFSSEAASTAFQPNRGS